MNFLNLGLLWVLPLAAIPVILHLLTLQRLKTVDLSTFRFLFDSYIQQRRRMKFLEWLIAFLRTLFLLLVVFAVARPVIKHWDALFGGGGSGRNIVLIIDASASMAAKTEGETSMQRAKRAALQILDRLNRDDHVTVLQAAARPLEICDRFSADVKTIRDSIEALAVTPGRANLFAAFAHLYGPETSQLNAPLIYLFTDLQTSNWREFNDSDRRRVVPDGTEIIVVNVGSNQDFSNTAIVGNAPEHQKAIVGLPVVLQPRVSNFSESETVDVTISVYVNEKEIARPTLSLEPGATATAEVVFTPNEPGILNGRYEIPSDRFTDDDVFRFSLPVAPRFKVVLVNDNPSADPRESEGLYLRTAMIATDTEVETHIVPLDGPELATEKDLIRTLDVVDIPEAGLGADALIDADVVILANCGSLQPAQFQLLTSYVGNGGGLLIFPGDRTDPTVWTEQFFKAPSRPEDVLLSPGLGQAYGDPDNSSTFDHFGAIDFVHPVFAVFAGEQRYLTKVNIYRRFTLILPEDSGNSWPIAQFSNGDPAIIDSRFENGRVLLTAFPFNTKWSNLPLRPEFVPLVLRMIGYVKRPAEIEGPSVVAAGAAAEIFVDQSWAPAEATVTDNAGRITRIPLERSNSRLVGAFFGTTEQGFYTINVRGADDSRRGRRSFAVNLSPEESDFTTLTGPQVSALLPDTRITTIDASAEAQQLHGGIGDEREIWRPLIMILFIVIGIEFFLSTLGGPAGDDDDESRPSSAQRLREFVRGTWLGKMTGANIDETTERSAP